MIRHMTPLGAALRGLAAGAAGAMALGALIKATQKLAPKPPEGAFEPADERQKSEMPPETVARRLVEDFMRRGPLDDAKKKRAGEIVHVAFGAAWGAVYGLHYGTHRVFHGPLGAALFGTIVWNASDNVLLPAFRLAPPFRKQSPAMHLYMWLIHVGYAEVLAATYQSLRSRTWLPIVAPIAARWAVRNVPRFARPAAYRVLETVTERRPAQRVRDAALGFAASM